MKIQIVGPVGSGKSTVAFEIKKALQDLGFDCTIIDPDGDVGSFSWISGHRTRVEGMIAAGTKIEIVTVNQPKRRGGVG